MATARERVEWDRTAQIVAMIHNVNCAKRSDQITDLRALNPYREKPKIKPMTLRELRKAMGG